MADEPSNTEEAAKRSQTRYLILETPDLGETFTLRTAIAANSADDARRSFFRDQDPEGVFAAVSENAIKLVERRVEKVSHVTVDELGPPRGLIPEAEFEESTPVGLITEATTPELTSGDEGGEASLDLVEPVEILA